MKEGMELKVSFQEKKLILIMKEHLHYNLHYTPTASSNKWTGFWKSSHNNSTVHQVYINQVHPIFHI